MKKSAVLAISLSCLFMLPGCGGRSTVGTVEAPHKEIQNEVNSPKASKVDAIPFSDEQLYAVAYVGYEELQDISFYEENYLENENLPVHHISEGEYYLIIPRYTDMEVRLYQNDIETGESILRYENKESYPFVVQCNVSDIFPDATIWMSTKDTSAEFSPYISLVDGSVQAGERGLDITAVSK